MLVLSSTAALSQGWRSLRSAISVQKLRARKSNRLQRESQNARLASHLKWQTSQHNQMAWRVMEVHEITDESKDCRSFYLRDAIGNLLPPFEPGQFVTVRPALGGSSLPARCYSLSDSPSQPWWRISVKDQSAGQSLSEIETSLSSWLHRRIRPGDFLLVNGPCGSFTLRSHTSEEPIVLLAAGIGITPLLSMLKHSLESAPNVPIHLFFQASDPKSWPFGEMLHTWQRNCAALNVVSYFSRSHVEHADLPGSIVQGKYDANCVINYLSQPTCARYYLCGPESWMKTLISQLERLGIPSDRIHFESFHASSDSIDETAELVEPWTLQLLQSGLRTAPSLHAESVWSAARKHGVELPAACHTGSCGTCKKRLLSGCVRYSQKPTVEVAEDEVLTCVAQPLGNVVIDA